MKGKWSVRSVNGEKNGQEGEWKSLDQIQGEQTLLTNHLFGMSFRIIPIGDGKYRISEFSPSYESEYDELMEEEGMDTEKAYEEIERELVSGEWTELNVRGLMDYGIVEGIYTKLMLEDKENGTHKSDEFVSNSDIETMKSLEWDEYFDFARFTDEEKLELLGKDDTTDALLMYKKYKKIVEEKEKSKTYGARAILEYMEKHNLTTQDLSLALAMAEATKTGVRDAESHIIDEKTSQITPDRKEPTQIE